MGNIVDISAYRRTCANCKWHSREGCRHPGGWHWDKKFQHCTDFERERGDKT